MLSIEKTEEFLTWARLLKDRRAAARIAIQVDRLASGNPGHAAPVGEGVSELKIDYGLGYRVYFTMKGKTVVILLCGGDKASQARDIERARELARMIRKGAP